MKRTFFAIILLIISISAFAQNEKLYLYEPDSSALVMPKHDKESKFTYNFSTGVSITACKECLTTTAFVAPEIGYKVSDKFTISGGFAVSYSMFPGFSENTNNNRMFNYTLFAKGSYHLTPKISIYGAAAVNFNDYYNSNKPSVAGIFGADYHVSEHSTISIAVSIRKNNSNFIPMEYGMHPLMHNSAFSPMFHEDIFER